MFKVIRNDLESTHHQKMVVDRFTEKALARLRESAEKMVRMMETMSHGRVHPQVVARKDNNGYEIIIPAQEVEEATKLQLIARAKALFPAVSK